MPLLNELPVDQWDPELRAMVNVETASPLELASTSIMAQSPHMLKANFAFLAKSLSGITISRRLLELVRLRIGFHNQCRSCMAMRFQDALDDGLTEDLVCSLEKPMEASNLTDAEKAAIEYADLFVTNHFAIDQAAIDKLRAHFSESQIVELGLFIGYFMGIGRFLASLGIVEELPEDYQDTGHKMAPWQSSATVLVGA